MKARVRGVHYHNIRKTFYLFYGLALGERVLRRVDSLTTTLQRPNLSAAEGQSVASMVVKSLATGAQRQYLTCFRLMF